MSIVTAYTPFTKLRPFKNSWRVQVKCLHSWKQHTSFGGDSFEMVLADQWVTFHLHHFFSFNITYVPLNLIYSCVF